MGQDRVVSAVVLVDASACRELDAVAGLLAGALGIPTVRISAAELSTTTITMELGTGVLTVGHRRVRPTVAWIRHAGAPVLWAYTGNGFDLRSWSSFLGQIAAVAAVALPGREPGHVDQLVDAERRGVSVPRTTVTTDPAAAPLRRAASATTVKAVGPHFADDAEPYPAEIVGRRDEPPGWVGGRTPVIVQQYVPHARELRVYYLDGAMCSFDVRKSSPAAIWCDPAGVVVARTRTSRAVARLVHRLATAWRLRYGAFDLLETAGGDLVFLEVNADGDWLWFEGRAAWPGGVTFLAAAMVSDLHTRALRERAAA
ncbi:hypothetical protein ACIBSW_12060 [Actinoplanes sp. NPDC049668]|uniref:hypothetical protein n=1 Tax=unclassified Actinoplanes TaxID=2626549 RepID=UPI0033B0421F